MPTSELEALLGSELSVPLGSVRASSTGMARLPLGVPSDLADSVPVAATAKDPEGEQRGEEGALLPGEEEVWLGSSWSKGTARDERLIPQLGEAHGRGSARCSCKSMSNGSSTEQLPSSAST